ncbi:MAG TPA: hypothetical protein VMC08_09710 [Bacteroidales bacterium]|nr:hypothetical protein [Bacteroidales bacterium]
MDTYLIISYHTAEDCDRALQYFHEYHSDYLTKFWWGCLDHDHNGYAIIDADSHEQAKMAVPPLARDKARIIKLTHFDTVMHHPA